MTARTDYTTDEVMFDAFAQPHGNCKPSGYAEYDAFQGRVVYSYTIEGITLDGWHVKHTVEYVDLGRPDRGIPVDPDAQMAAERVEGLEPDVPDYRPQRKTARLLLAINEALQARPLSTAELAGMVGASVNTVKHTMNNHPHGFDVLGRDVTGYVYGIKGHHYDRPAIGHGVRRVVDYLLEHGPRSSIEIMRDLGIAQFTFDEALRRGGDVFVRVGLRPSGARPAIVWGVCGVHKEQEVG